MMALTGGAYLFKPELDHFIYRAWDDVPLRTGPLAPASAIVRQVELETNARVLQLTPSANPARAVRLLARGPTGQALTVFADPYTGHVTGSTAFGGVMQVVRKVHSLQKFGFWASCLIEIAAGWSIVLVGTGLFLWWPRGRTSGVMTVRGSPRHRMFWRDLHAVTGVFSCAVILFLAVTGMPWSMFWGDHVQRWATAANLNEPAPPAQVTPEWLMAATMPGMPHAPHAQDAAVNSATPWAMAKMDVPASHDSSRSQPIDIDQAAAILRRLGVASDATLALPDGPKGAYVATSRPDRVEDTRIVYLDQYSGAVLGDVRFNDWGPVGKAIEWGIAVHQGQEYGTANRYLMLAGCIAIVLLAVSSFTMWWKRRPKGSLGVPPSPAQSGALRGLLAIMIAVGILFPLVGVSLLLAVAIDRVVLLGARRRCDP
jgi:uncharacterized iron-regulated membrane protein